MGNQEEGIVVILEKNKETDNTIRYANVLGVKGVIVQYIYIRKAELELLGNPDKIEIVIKGVKP